MSDTVPQDMAKIEELLQVMVQLRDPESGCPWDIKQDFASIAPYTIEEAYEVADAIDRNQLGELRDELGDLLLQVVFHARMAEEIGEFSFEDVVQSIVDKMIRRHPHVFVDDGVDKPVYSSTEELNRAWELQKSRERASNKATDPSAVVSPSALDGIALNLPSLVRAAKVQKRAARVGFDWQEIAPVVAKVHEELAELEQELQDVGTSESSDAEQAVNHDRVEDELGDLLFAVVNLSRHADIDPEIALRKATDKFGKRFRLVEKQAQNQSLELSSLSLDALDELWESAKKAAANPDSVAT